MVVAGPASEMGFISGPAGSAPGDVCAPPGTFIPTSSPDNVIEILSLVVAVCSSWSCGAVGRFVEGVLFDVVVILASLSGCFVPASCGEEIMFSTILSWTSSSESSSSGSSGDAKLCPRQFVGLLHVKKSVLTLRNSCPTSRRISMRSSSSGISSAVALRKTRFNTSSVHRMLRQNRGVVIGMPSSNARRRHATRLS